MSIMSDVRVSDLPDTPYNLWERDELDDLLELPHDGIRVEIIGGRIVLSPVPVVVHGVILNNISRAFGRAADTIPDFPWETMQVTRLSQETVHQGYVPDLLVLQRDALDAAYDADARGLVPDEIEMTIEVTSRGNSAQDRPPTDRRRMAGRTKWSGYASVEIPYYLLIDRSPKAAKTTLYSIPDHSAGAYLHQESWEFGETVQLPEPFNIEVETTRWKPWKP